MSTLADQEDLVKESLFKFLRKYIPSAQLSQIDEIVLSYVVSILEELGSDDGPLDEEAFDLEGFCEMMAAYLPEFSIIQPGAVCAWMFELATNLGQKRKSAKSELQYDRELPPLPPVTRVHQESSGSSQSSDQGWEKEPSTKRVHQLSETSDGSSDSGDYLPTQEEQAYIDSQLQLLMEMFPAACSLEVRHCLAIAGGDVEQAAQLVLHRQEAGQSLTSSHSIQSSGLRHKPKIDDQQLKEKIIARYSYIDQAESSREHRPVAPKSEPKKMVRYRDNKIVSLKGERFTEVKKDDEEDCKKPYVSLKPAKQYPRTMN